MSLVSSCESFLVVGGKKNSVAGRARTSYVECRGSWHGVTRACRDSKGYVVASKHRRISR